MSAIRHRPTDETLAAFAAGRLDSGLALVVASHIEVDRESRLRLHDFHAVQGALLDTAQPAAMTGTAAETIERGRADVPAVKNEPHEPDMPAVLAPYSLGAWKPIGFRVAMRRVEVPAAEARVFMLRAGPGVSLPAHKHTGFEWTTILSGAYEHEGGRFAAGDFDEADAEHEHTPRVDPVEGCTCIVAMTGTVLLQGWLGRLLQPLVRF